MPIFFASKNNLPTLEALDDLPKNLLWNSVKNKHVLIFTQEETIRGFLRFSLFWSHIPMIDMIRIQKEYQRQGYGKALLDALEKHVKITYNCPILLSSSQSDEAPPQEWHAKMGFHPTGRIESLSPLQATPEIIFVKNL